MEVLAALLGRERSRDLLVSDPQQIVYLECPHPDPVAGALGSESRPVVAESDIGDRACGLRKGQPLGSGVGIEQLDRAVPSRGRDQPPVCAERGLSDVAGLPREYRELLSAPYVHDLAA